MPVEPQKITPIHFVPRFCSQCGQALSKRYIEQERQERLACAGCGHVAYLNPYIVAGAIPRDAAGNILLLKRGIEPAKGAWTFPAGFVELGESVEEAAVRETLEETGYRIRLDGLLGIYSYADAGVATAVFTADVVGGEAALCHETEEVRAFDKGSLPWERLAFRSTQDALRDWSRRP